MPATIHPDRDCVGEVIAWRMLRFLELGCDTLGAETLAAAMHGDDRVDLHDFADLIAAGCSVGLAREILL